jgi:hypothetical protein
MFWYLCLWRAAGSALSLALRSPPHHQIISETSWAAAGTPPIINYPFSLSLSLLRPFGSLTLHPSLMHIACLASFRMQKLCAREFDIPHPPLFALGRGINLQHTGCRAASFEWQIFCLRAYFAFRADQQKYSCGSIRLWFFELHMSRVFY